MDLGPDDVGYVVHAAVPLQRGAGRVGAVARRTARRSGWPAGSPRRAGCADVRRYGATYFNYTGKPLAYLLATPEQPDDADNPLRVAFGNEGSPEVVDASPGASASRSSTPTARPRAASRSNRDASEPGRRARARGPARAGRRRRRQRAARAPASTPTAGCVERRRVRRRDRQHRGRRPVRGLLQQRRGDRPDHALRLVLVGRPRLPRRRRLPLLRGPQRRLDPRRRRELPGRADRGRARAPPRRRPRRGLRRARRRRPATR